MTINLSLYKIKSDGMVLLPFGSISDAIFICVSSFTSVIITLSSDKEYM